MISYIRGEVLFRNESSVVIDVNGIGYEVFVPYNVMCALERTTGTIELYTYLQIKEDGASLFGFASKEELRLFKLLITVNGIGPKGALGIMSYMSVNDLILAVLADDAKTISKAPGIGSKTAGKLILELKDKFKLEDTLQGPEFINPGIGSVALTDSAGKAKPGSGSEEQNIGKTGAKNGSAGDTSQYTVMRNEAVQALIALGYSSSQALKAIRAVPDEEGLTVEKLLKQSLKFM